MNKLSGGAELIDGLRPTAAWVRAERSEWKVGVQPGRARERLLRAASWTANLCAPEPPLSQICHCGWSSARCLADGFSPSRRCDAASLPYLVCNVQATRIEFEPQALVAAASPMRDSFARVECDSCFSSRRRGHPCARSRSMRGSHCTTGMRDDTGIVAIDRRA
jgi:hypothetical protein